MSKQMKSSSVIFAMAVISLVAAIMGALAPGKIIVIMALMLWVIVLAVAVTKKSLTRSIMIILSLSAVCAVVACYRGYGIANPIKVIDVWQVSRDGKETNMPSRPDVFICIKNTSGKKIRAFQLEFVKRRINDYGDSVNVIGPITLSYDGGITFYNKSDFHKKYLADKIQLIYPKGYEIKPGEQVILVSMALLRYQYITFVTEYDGSIRYSLRVPKDDRSSFQCVIKRVAYAE